VTIDLAAVRERADAYAFNRRENGAYNCAVTGSESADDVPALLAEIERLRRVEACLRTSQCTDDPFDETNARIALQAALDEETTR
jgi:hypothetical protein